MSKVALIRPDYKRFHPNPDPWESTWIRHGIASIIAYSKVNGLDIDLIDMRRLTDWNEFQERAKHYDYLGISCFTSELSVTNECINKIKEVNPKARIIIGGPHANVRTGDFGDNPVVDHVILGEGEIAFGDLITLLERGETPPKCWSGERPDLDSIPFVDRDMWESEEDGTWETGMPYFTLISSRACMKNCTFCQPYARTVFGNKMRNRSPENVVGELNYLKNRYGMKSFLLLDDNIIQDAKWMQSFINLYKEAGIKANFPMEGSADYLVKNPWMVPELKQIGCTWFNVGFESGSQRMLDYMRKGTTVAQNREAVELLRKYKIKIFGNILFGMPTETKTEAMETVKFVKWAKLDWFSPSFYTPYPGNELAAECEAKGLVFHYDDSKELARNVGKPKIRGVDYDFLNHCVQLCYGNSAAFVPRMVSYLPSPMFKVAQAVGRKLPARIKRAVGG